MFHHAQHRSHCGDAAAFAVEGFVTERSNSICFHGCDPRKQEPNTRVRFGRALFTKTRANARSSSVSGTLEGSKWLSRGASLLYIVFPGGTLEPKRLGSRNPAKMAGTADFVTNLG